MNRPTTTSNTPALDRALEILGFQAAERRARRRRVPRGLAGSPALDEALARLGLRQEPR